MPTYEYKCKDCDESLEVVQAFTDDALTECPSCAGRLKKVFGSIGISFRGSGFYKNDASGGSKANGSGSSADTGADSSKSDSSKSDSAKSDSSKSDSKSDSGKSESKSSSGTASPKKSEKRPQKSSV